MGNRIILTFMSGPDDGRVIELEASGFPSEIKLGRLTSCTLPLTDDPEVSRLHARLFLSETGWQLEDCGSNNGTFIGEFSKSRKVDKAVHLVEGDFFRIGRTRFRLEPANQQVNHDKSQNRVKLGN